MMQAEPDSAAPTPSRPPPPPPPLARPRRRAPLYLDRVRGSQPELGPAAPDGGAGWVVVAAAALLRVSLPPLALAYGAVVVRDAAAGAPAQALPPEGADAWDGTPLWVPALFSAAWSFTAPWGRVVAGARGARAACGAGVALAASAHAASALLLAAANASVHSALVGVAALLAGSGCCVALSPPDCLLRRYFRVRLLRAQALVRVAQALAVMFGPLALYSALERWGAWRAQLAQATFAVTAGLLAAAALSPPRTVRPTGSPPVHADPSAQGYDLLQNEPEAEAAGPSARKAAAVGAGAGAASLNLAAPGPSGLHRLDPDSDVELLPMATSSSDEDAQGGDKKERPQPLFGRDGLSPGSAAVFVDDVAEDDEEVVLYSLGADPRGHRFRDELRMLFRPMFYLALTVVVTARLSSLAYWLLAPALVWQRADQLTDLQALGVVALGGVADMALAWAWPWLRPLDVKAKARLLALAAAATAVGFVGLGGGAAARGVMWLQASALAARAGLAAAEALGRVYLLDTLGVTQCTHALSPLDALTGLIVLLATLGVGPVYSKVFSALAWMNVAASLAVVALYFGSVIRRRRGGR